MTRLVGHAEPEGLLVGVDPALARIYRFRRADGATILAAWAVDGEVDVVANIQGGPGFVPAAADATERVPPKLVTHDLYGNRIDSPVKDGKIHLTGQPVYLVISR